MSATKPVIAITLGDPAGIGPEIVLGALSSQEVYDACIPLVVGNTQLMRRCAAAIREDAGRIKGIEDPVEAAGVMGKVEVINVDVDGADTLQPGRLSREAGAAAEAFIRRACELGLAGDIDAISTTPINKESLRLAGVKHIGHTEMLAAYLGSCDPLTMFMTENMRIFFLSRHLSLRQAVDFVTADRVYVFVKQVHDAMTRFGFKEPKIGLAALNPHASDGGQFGSEEEEHLIPAAQRARQDGINCTDPIGADSVFNMALEGRFDCVISLYHDQGHIAAKTRDFHGTVTATLNLPVLRTSVDHGTALDIAWQGNASSVSMKAAILAAANMIRVLQKH